MFPKLLLTNLLLLSLQLGFAQTAILRGTVTASDNNAVVTDASVVLAQTGLFAATDSRGAFTLFDVPPGEYTIVVSRAGFLPFEQKTTLQAGQDAQLNISLERDPNATLTNTSDIPTINLDEAETEADGIGEISNLLHASRDVFQNFSSFGWSVFRFRERGYDSEFFPIYLNGININDPETGIAFFGEFGGLNDVLRVRQTGIGLEPVDFAFSEIGGATHIDTRAGVQRKQVRASYAISNRTYTNRVMVTASTGLMPGGWAVSVSGSRRWAQEGWHDGTFFDGYGYFISIDKKFGEKHGLNLCFLGSPNSRGRVGDTFQEMFDLAGTTRYNPNWGYWNGDKRNAYVSHGHQPIALLRYDLKPSRQTTLTFSAYGQFGQNGFTRLDWFNANSPEPDYNRRLPSSLENAEQSATWAQYLRENESARQIDWVGIWEGNTINTSTIENANGVPGNSVTGKRSQTIIGDYRSDSREAGFNAVLRQSLSTRFTLNGGANYQWYRGRNFITADDLLGGDFILDQARFVDDLNQANNDIRVPNRIVREGETYGYDYDENIRNGGAWMQLQGNLPRISFFAAVENLYTQFWRTGYMQNGRFPDASLGDSKKVSFFNYGLKGGLTYKLTGRHYLYVHGFHGTRAQRLRNVFISPRTRNDLVVEDPESYTVNSVEGGFQWRAPRFKARGTAYYTKIEDAYENYMTFSPASSVFGSRTLIGVDRQHTGVELAFEAKPFVSWTFSAAANLGRYIYTSRPYLIETEDNTGIAAYPNNFTNLETLQQADTLTNPPGIAYLKNFYVPRTPQTTASFAVKYESRRFWFATLTLNWADNSWYLFDQRRRTADYVANIPKDSELYRFVIDQQKAPAAFTLDLFGGKSWRLNNHTFVYLTVGVNNLLNNTNIITSGRDATRNAFRDDLTDVRLYTNQIIYAPGTNYFISLALRI